MHYAGKAFLCTEVVRWLDDEGLVAGRLHRRRAGRWRCAPASRPSGSRCTAPTSRRPSWTPRVEAGVGAIVSTRSTRSPGWTRASPRAGTRSAPVMVRVTVGVEAHTHEFIATAHEDQKFGFSLAGGRRRGGGPPGARVPTGSAWSACTRTSARRSSTRPASRSPRTGWSRCSTRSCAGAPAAAPDSSSRSTSAAASASPTRADDDPPRAATRWPSRCARSSAGSARSPGWPCRGRRRARPGDRRPGHRHRLRGRHHQGRARWTAG